MLVRLTSCPKRLRIMIPVRTVASHRVLGSNEVGQQGGGGEHSARGVLGAGRYDLFLAVLPRTPPLLPVFEAPSLGGYELKLFFTLVKNTCLAPLFFCN